MMSTFQRARKPEHKEERRLHLLKTARAMLTRQPDLDTMSLTQLAKRAQMAKSNVYRYFETREALLLAVLWEEWSAWHQTVSDDLKSAHAATREAPSLVGYLARTLAQFPLLCALTAALPTVLERNLSDAAIRKFKRDSLGFFDEMGRLLESHAPALSSNDYAGLLRDAACLMAGLYPHAHPSKAVSRVLKSPELAFFRHDFASDLERVMVALAQSTLGSAGTQLDTAR